mgnify:CR=1 FL=1
MKKKLCCILILITLLLNSSIMLVISEAVDAVNQTKTEEDKIKALSEINLTKYENYDTTTENSESGSKGVLVQFNLKTGIEFAEDEEYEAIQKTKTNIELPRIKNYKPSRVEVIVKSTQATNGRNEAKYEYHSSTGILSIMAENVDYTQKKEDARDEYEIICIYGKDCYTDSEERNFKVRLNTYEILKNDEKKVLPAKVERDYTCKNAISGVISTSHETENIYDGYINANKLNSENKYETTYSEKLNIMVSNKDIAQKINITETSTTSLYTETTINKEQVLEVIGENGSIDIIDEDSNIVKIINKDSVADDNGEIKLVYKNRTQNLKIQLNDIEKEGIIEIKNSRVIEPTAEITDNKIQTLINIQGINEIETEVENDDGNKELITDEIMKYEQKGQSNVQIKSAMSDIDISLDNDVFANLKANNTNIRLTLKTDGPQYSLFKNPTISIEMPKEMESVKIATPEIMFDNNTFEIISAKVDINNKGNKVINIYLQGDQTSYNQVSLVNGVNIVIPVKIGLTKKLENKTQTIKYTYSNEMTSSTESKEKQVTLLNKIVNDYSNQYQAISAENKEETESIISITKEISAGNKKDIYEKQVQKITLSVKNNTNTEIANINIQDEIPTEFTYESIVGDQGHYNGYIDDEKITSYEKKIEKLKANETLTFEYYVRVKQGQELQGKTISSKAKAIIDGNTEIFESNTIENTIKESKFQIDMVATTNKDGLYREGTKISYKIVAKNITNETLTDVTIKSKIPEEATFNEAAYLIYDEEIKGYIKNDDEENINKNYDKNSRIVTWNIGTLEAGKEVGVLVAMNLNEIQDNIDTRVVTTTATVKANNTQEYVSNKEEIIEVNNGTCQVKLETNLKDKYVYEGDEFQYIVTITNNGNVAITDSMMIDELPDGIIGMKVDYNMQGNMDQTLSILQKASISFSLEPGEIFTAKISVYADELKDGVEKLEVKNLVKISSGNVQETTSNEIVNVILKKSSNPTEPDNPSNPDNPTTPDNPAEPDTPSNPNNPTNGYNISGIAWLDSNQNGSRDNEEQGIGGIQVKLYYENGEVVKDSNGKDINVTTDNEGKYTFSNLKKGSYVVAFLYDNKEYTTTEYQKEGVNENINSDALETSIEENKEEKIVGLTNTIKLTNTDAINIDIGLIKNGVFDLKLEKSINKVIVQNNKKTKTYEIGNKKSKTSKIEIDRKTVNSTNIVVEYQISVTNEGEVAGYAQEIIDYKPKELEFNSELNSDWYLINDNLMNTSLAEKIIEPGETVSLSLVLTKKLTENDFKTITNIAEISEDYNEKLIYDIDSTPGNKVENEDDMSSVSLIIAVSTGIAIAYTTTVIIMMIIIVLGIYLIKKNFLGKEEKNEQN